MRLDTSKLIKKPELSAEDKDYHKHNRFFAPSMLEKPEFVYRNHLIALKDADMELLENALANDEAEESKRALLASQEGITSQQNMGKPAAKDAKKDAKKPAGKGA